MGASTGKPKYTVRELDFSNHGEFKAAAEVIRLAVTREPWNWDLSENESLSLLATFRHRQVEHAKTFAAFDAEGRLVGVAHGRRYSPYQHIDFDAGPGRHYYFDTIAVHPDLQHKGVAKALDPYRLAHATELDCDSIVAWTKKGTVARTNHYEQMGFKFVKNVEHPAFVMPTRERNIKDLIMLTYHQHEGSGKPGTIVRSYYQKRLRR